MTDTEIIKALECCAYGDGCEDCPRSKICDGGEHMQNAIDLINRQRAEIELWQNEYKRACAERDAHIATTKFIRAEAVKEFAERLKETKFKHNNDYIIYAENIDVLVKEMAGEDNVSAL